MRRLIPVGLVALLLAPSAHAQELRFSRTAPGGIAATGNTLGLSKASGANAPGTLGSIGTFISVDPSSIDDDPVHATPWPLGTTNDWGDNGSSARLRLPDGATVLYAEVVWGGSFKDVSEDVTTYIDDAIALSFGGSHSSVSPDESTALTLTRAPGPSFAYSYYVRSADVTSFVQANGAGVYTVSGVPATQSQDTNSLNAAGWTLVVAYRSDRELIRNLSIFVGGTFVDEHSTQDYTATGFCAPPFGPVEGRVLVSAMEGDADLGDDTLSIAEDAGSTFVPLAGPNNPETNFFASQINDRDGVLDTSGSFGESNHSAFTKTNTSGGRQGWDITAVPVSSDEGMLANDQRSAVLRTDTTGDSFIPTLLAFEIDVKAPALTQSGTTVDPGIVEIGGQITVTATLKNTGAAPATNLQFVLNVDPGLDLAGYTTDGDDGDAQGGTVTVSGLANGVPAGSLAVDAQRVIQLVFDVVEPPQSDDFVFSPIWRHTFVTCDSEPAINETHAPPTASVRFDEGDDEDTGDGDIDGGLGEPKCGCASASPAPWWAGLLALALAVRRRR